MIWQTVKVFISSTFRDMNSERDVLIKYVFPELRSRARSLNVDVREIDLRWGITEAESNDDKLLEICLTEITKCQLFVGVLGERYGHIPKSYEISEINPDLMWLQEYPKGASLTELEFHLAALAHPNEAKERAFFYIRNDFVYGDIPKRHIKDFVDESVENRRKLSKLKRRLCESGLEVYNNYPCSVSESASGKSVIIDLHEFGQRVLDNLWTALQKICVKPDEGYNEQLKESSLHTSFAESKNRCFVGRKELVANCIETILSIKQGLVIIHGKQGSGKTSLMAHLIHVLDEKIKQRYPVIFFFVGATMTSGFSLSILRFIAEQISTKANLNYEFSSELSNSFEEFQNVVIQGAKILEKLVVFIDGLDALKKEQQLKMLEYLQTKMPPGVTVVCTAVTNSPVYKGLNLLPPEKAVTIGPMGLADKMQIIRKNLSTHSKALDESSFNNQLNMLALKHESSLPLFISLACEELRTFGIFEKLSEKIKLLSSTMEGLLQNIFERLEEDYSHKLIAGALGFLTVCENGLNEEDLHILLSTYLTKFDEISCLDDAKNLSFALDGITFPRIRFYQLVRSLHCLLQITDHACDRILRLEFSNVANAVRARYRQGVLSATGQLRLHYIIAAYFWKLVNPFGNDCWSAGIPRGLSAVPYHLLASGTLKELVDLLSDLGFIQSNFEAENVDQLLEKYCSAEILFNLSKAKALRLQTGLETVKQYERFIKRNMHVLKLVPQLTLQQAFNEPGDSVVSANAKHALKNVCNKIPPLITWMNKPVNLDSCLSTLKLSMPALCTSMSADEKYFAYGEANTVHLYDVEANKKVVSFIGHGSQITSLLFIGQNKLCSADNDGVISIWNIEPNYRIHVLTKHSRRVSACCCDPAGLNLVAVSWDGAISLWKVNSGEEVKFISPEKKWSPINCVAFHPVKQMVIAGSWDGTLKIWCLMSFQCKAIIHAHAASVCSVSISPNGKLILSTSLDCSLKLWSSTRGFQIACIKNSSTFTSASFTPSGSHVIAANEDKTIKIYSSSLGQKVSSVRNIRNIALTCLLLSSETVVTGFEDGVVQSRTFMTGSDERQIRCGDGSVTCLAWCKISAKNEHLRLIVGMQYGKLKLVKFHEFEVDKDLLGHTSDISSVAFLLPTMIVSGSDSGCIAIHYLPWIDKNDSVAASFILHDHHGSITSISPIKWNYKHFATIGDDYLVMTWQTASFVPDTATIQSERISPEPKAVIRGCHSGSITACCWVKHANHKSPLLVTASKDLTVCAWDSSDGNRAWIKKNFDAPITYLECLQKHLVIGASLDGKIYTWSPSGMNLMEIDGSGESFFSIYSDDANVIGNWYDMAVEEEKQLASGGKDPTVTQQMQSLADDLSKILIARAGPVGDVNIIKPCLDDPMEILVGHSDSVISVASGIGDKMVSSSHDGTVKVWKPQCFLNSRNETAPELSHTSAVACLAEGTTKDVVITGDRDGYIIIWHMDKNGAWKSVYKTKAHQKAVTVLLVLPYENGLFVSAANDCNLNVWKYESVVPINKVKHRISLLKEEVDDEPVPLWMLNLLASKNLSSPVISAIMHSKEKSLIVGTSSETLFEVDLQVKHDQRNQRWELFHKELSYSHFCDHQQIKPWTTHLKRIDMKKSNEMFIFSVNSLSTIALWKVNCDCSKNSLFTQHLADMMGKQNPATLNCHRETWPTAVEIFKASSENDDLEFKVLMGFASGELMAFTLRKMYGEKFEASEIILRKLHNGAVNGVALCSKMSKDTHPVICTSGEDHVIKIWKVFQENSYKQLSQFYCKSPITCILSCQFEKDDQKINVVCGDTLGHVYMLSASL